MVSGVNVQIVGDAVNNLRDVLVLLADVLVVNNHLDVLVLLPVVLVVNNHLDVLVLLRDVLVLLPLVNNHRDVLVVVFSFRHFSLTLFHLVASLCFHSFFIFCSISFLSLLSTFLI